MNWQSALQVFMTGLAGIGAWFLYELIKEFKGFKKEAGRDINDLKNEREKFQVTIRNAELSIALRVTDLQKIHQDYSARLNEELNFLKQEMLDIRLISGQARRNAENHAEFLKKSLEVSKHLNLRLKVQEKEMTDVKIKLNDLMVFKTGK